MRSVATDDGDGMFAPAPPCASARRKTAFAAARAFINAGRRGTAAHDDGSTLASKVFLVCIQLNFLGHPVSTSSTHLLKDYSFYTSEPSLYLVTQ